MDSTHFSTILTVVANSISESAKVTFALMGLTLTECVHLR